MNSPPPYTTPLHPAKTASAETVDNERLSQLNEEQVNILLVDDRKENLLSLEAILDDLGQHIIPVTSGMEALRVLLQYEVAVILLDVNLPGMNGYETASLIRERDQTRHTPIIFLTAMDRAESQEFTGYAVGAVDYIYKPLNPEVLKAKVQVFIDLNKKSRAIFRLNAELERRVRERTSDLNQANEVLKNEIKERMRAEERIRGLNQELEARVRERTAELEVANRELESFSYSVSHDLRAPLRKIESFTGLLLEEYADLLDEKGKDYTRRIASSSRRMTELIEDLLKLSRASSDEMRLERVDLSKIVSEITSEFQRNQPHRKVSLEIEQNIIAHCDGRLLRLALFNLLENAWKFTGKRDRTIIKFGTMDRNGAREFFVSDNGAGFDPALQGRIFDPFQRVHAYTEFPGTGIGLAIVKRVIRRHLGDIRVETQIDRGTTFYFTLQAM